MNKYLVIGNGRVATHMAHYFGLLRKSSPTLFQVTCWSRKQQNELAPLKTLAGASDRILLLISDSAISDFLQENSFLESSKLVHFSGALTHPEISGAHPLMTFGPELYSLEQYHKIPFITEVGRKSLKELLPDLPNKEFHIQAEKKSLYHALCSMSGNFSTLLWESVIAKFDTELNLPRETILPYLEQTTRNLIHAKDSVLTGPLVRKEFVTVTKHLDALAGTPEQNLYYAFLNYFIEKNKFSSELKDEYTRI